MEPRLKREQNIFRAFSARFPLSFDSTKSRHIKLCRLEVHWKKRFWLNKGERLKAICKLSNIENLDFHISIFIGAWIGHTDHFGFLPTTPNLSPSSQYQ